MQIASISCICYLLFCFCSFIYSFMKLLCNCFILMLTTQENSQPCLIYSFKYAGLMDMDSYNIHWFLLLFSNKVFNLFTPCRALSLLQLTTTHIAISNIRLSTATRGLRHAILKISISVELFGETVNSVCASGNRHEPSSSQRGQMGSQEERGELGDVAREGIKEAKRKQINIE